MSCNAKAFVEIRLVIIDDVDTGKLCKNLNEDCKDNPLPVVGFGEKLFSVTDSDTFFKTDLVTHLCKFGLQE